MMRPAIRAYWRLVCLALLVTGCRETIELKDGYFITTDLACAQDTPPDMTVAPPACPAAKGLSGDNILCVDFANPQTTIAALTTQGWKFDVGMTGNCAGWVIMDSFLQVSNYKTLNGDCGLTVQPVTAAALQKYNRVTLSIQHRIALGPQQLVRTALNTDSDVQNVMWQNTGIKNVPRQQTVITLDKSDLPQALQLSGFSWLFKLSAQLPIGLDGWQIESVALTGTK